jgi:A/G-specific adenine glycosylase
LNFPEPLLEWYTQNKRDLPWRRTRDAYRILLSEIMLQQTQVQTVIPYYHRFLKAFPDFHALADAPLNKVLKLWEGLGYYSRARNLHTLAKTVSRRHKGILPADYIQILALPGVGRYTAGAVMSIAFGQDYPVVDGNVIRVFCRYFGITENVSKLPVQKQLWDLASRYLPAGQASDYNQALMELGATVCTPRAPACLLCCLAPTCEAYKQGRQNEWPVKSKKGEIPHREIGAGVIWHEDKILISQRPLKGLLGGLWEFPGGKLEPGETLAQCVAREIKEELGIKVKVGKEMLAVDHAYSHFRITLHAFECQYVSGEPQKLGVQDWRWVTPQELKKFAFPGANQPIIKLIREKR